MRTNATEEELLIALDEVNKKYDNNIIFNRYPERIGNQYIFTLRVNDSKKAGHRLGFSFKKDGNRRRLTSACWHVHGNFFDALFNLRGDIFIWSGKNKITKDYGNWKDRDIGSIMHPLYFSEACECN